MDAIIKELQEVVLSAENVLRRLKAEKPIKKDNSEQLRALILAMYADDAQYPQLRLPGMQKDRLKKMMKLI